MKHKMTHYLSYSPSHPVIFYTTSAHSRVSWGQERDKNHYNYRNN